MIPRRRVVITGMGIIAAAGNNLQTFWGAVVRGESPASAITRFDVSALPTRIAAEIKHFNAADYIGSKRAKRYDLSIQYAVAASMEAMADSGLNMERINPDRVGVVEAVTLSGLESAFKGQIDYIKNGYKRLSPYYLINAYSGGGSGEIALNLGCKGQAVTYSSGSASGNDAVGYASTMIRDDDADVIVAGGVEAPLMPPIFGGFCAASLMTKGNETPARSMKPFDASQDGFLLGEGAAFLVLEELNHALTRGARIYAEIMGHGRSCEAHHSVNLHPEGTGLRKAIAKALKAAEVQSSDIKYINAHGTATANNDSVETLAIEKFFGDHAKSIAVSGTKPITGHMLGAAGAVETLITALAIHHSMIPQTPNFQKPLKECLLDYVPHPSRPYQLERALNINSGFGGKNSCLVLGRYC